MKNKWYLYLLIVLVIAPLVAVYAYQDDLVVFNSWSSGEPKIMVKLEIHIPPVNTGFCGVIVRKLPSLYRPTKTGFSEEVYVGIHRPGETIVVKELLTAIVAKTKIEEGEYKVEYYEPVEYFVAVACMRGNKTTHKYTKIHEIYPNKLVTTHRIEVEFKEQTNKVVGGVGNGTNSLSCKLYQVNPPPGVLDAVECITWVRGPYLYSLSGLKTSFGLLGGPIPSAIYLESYGDAASCVLDSCNHDIPQWSSAGKKLAYSLVTGETGELSGEWRDRVYFNTIYRYEKLYVGFKGLAGIGMLVWLLYPVDIRGLGRSAEWSQFPYEQEHLSSIPPAPSYSAGPVIGNVTIWFRWFTPTYTQDAVIISSTNITFAFPFGVVTLPIGFYKAGRDDLHYTTPYVKVTDVSRNTQAWYYWWYRDDDETTYEIIFSNYR